MTNRFKRTIRKLQTNISLEECQRYIIFLNNSLSENELVKHQLPIDTSSFEQFFDTVSEGLLLPTMINEFFPDTINQKLLEFKPKRSMFEINILHEKCIEAAKKIGCRIVGIGGQNLTEKNQTLVLGLVWQIIKQCLLLSVTRSYQNNELLKESMDNTEEELDGEQLVIEWLNYYISKVDPESKITNFGDDVKDGKAYLLAMLSIIQDHELVLINEIKRLQKKKNLTNEEKRQLEESIKRLEQLKELERKIKKCIESGTVNERLELIGELAKFLDCDTFISIKDIKNGNTRMNLAFAATLLNKGSELGKGATQEISKSEKIKEDINNLNQKIKDLQKVFLNKNVALNETFQKLAKNLKNCPVPGSIIAALIEKYKKGDEELTFEQVLELLSKDPDILKASPDILLRWLNYCLKQCGFDKILKNFTSLKDGIAFSTLFETILTEERAILESGKEKLKKEFPDENLTEFENKINEKIKFIDQGIEESKNVRESQEEFLKLEESEQELVSSKILISEEEKTELKLREKMNLRRERKIKRDQLLDKLNLNKSKKIIDISAKYLNIPKIISAQDIMKGNIEETLTFLGLIFKRHLSSIQNYNQLIEMKKNTFLQTIAKSISNNLHKVNENSFNESINVLKQIIDFDENNELLLNGINDFSIENLEKIILIWINNILKKNNYPEIESLKEMINSKVYSFLLKEMLLKDYENIESQIEIIGDSQFEEQYIDYIEDELLIKLENLDQDLHNLMEIIEFKKQTDENENEIENSYIKINGEKFLQIAKNNDFAKFVSLKNITNTNPIPHLSFCSEIMNLQANKMIINELILKNLQLKIKALSLEEKIKKSSNNRINKTYHSINNEQIQLENNEKQMKLNETILQKIKNKESIDEQLINNLKNMGNKEMGNENGNNQENENENEKENENEMEKGKKEFSSLNWINGLLKKYGSNYQLKDYKDLKNGLGFASIFAEMLEHEIQQTNKNISRTQIQLKHKINNPELYSKEQVDEQNKELEFFSNYLIDGEIHFNEMKDIITKGAIETTDEEEYNKNIQSIQEQLKKVATFLQIDDNLFDINNENSIMNPKFKNNDIGLSITSELYSLSKKKQIEDEKQNLILQIQDKIINLNQSNKKLKNESIHVSENLEKLLLENDTIDEEFEKYKKDSQAKQENEEQTSNKNKQNKLKEIVLQMTTLKDSLMTKLENSQELREKKEKELEEFKKNLRKETLRLVQEKTALVSSVEERKNKELQKLKNLLSRVKKEGFLFLREDSLLRPKYKRKWFTLRDNIVTWAKSPEKIKKPEGLFFTNKCRFYNEVVDSKDKKGNLFEIKINNEKIIRMSASSAEVRKEWIQALTKSKNLSTKGAILKDGNQELK
ncbi:fimbrin-4 [Anaeramoeba flamelloides]|uniref:Fimbrin-4 n=1 Tax=Anaeramoeba flamelloides TaxID=1746091 RepID=A0AAV8A4J2_9EUKA|nr:fimbrin-4 [Anaeramoeba flamelloides]